MQLLPSPRSSWSHQPDDENLAHYVDVMGEQTAHGSTVAENEAVLETSEAFIRRRGMVQNYVLFEVNQADRQYRVMSQGFTQWKSFIWCS